MRRLLPVLAILALITAACGGDTTTTTLSETTTSQPSTSSTDATTPPESTTTVGSPTTARFAITEVDFLDGTVTITNVGGEPGSLDGHAICQRPNYFTIQDVELEPGESVEISAGEVGGISPTSGEVGLYSQSDFGSSDAIISYVEWGDSGHGRSSVAVAAGIWQADAFVETSASTGLITTSGVTDTPDEWEVG